MIFWCFLSHFKDLFVIIHFNSLHTCFHRLLNHFKDEKLHGTHVQRTCPETSQYKQVETPPSRASGQPEKPSILSNTDNPT